MKTPHAILIGLSLIAAAIFFKDTVVKPAHAFGGPGDIEGFSCVGLHCYLLDNSLRVYTLRIKGMGEHGKWKKVK